MFNNLGNQSTVNAAHNSVDDIFAETDATTNQAAGNIQVQPAGLSSGSIPAGIEQPDMENKGGKGKMLFIILLAVLILGAAGYLVYAKIMKGNQQEDLGLDKNITVNSSSSAPTGDIQPVANNNVIAPQPEISASGTIAVQPESMVGEQNSSSSLVKAPVVSAPVDSDGDSLLDSEESTLGTNPTLIDSDFDGLSDYEEVKVYKSDPNKADSDGDGYNDGDEVKNGYNPAGSGKLQ